MKHIVTINKANLKKTAAKGGSHEDKSSKKNRRKNDYPAGQTGSHSLSAAAFRSRIACRKAKSGREQAGDRNVPYLLFYLHF